MMAKTRRSSLSIPRGLIGAVVAALGAMALVVISTAGFVVGRWMVTGASEFDRGYDVRLAREPLAIPLIGCAIIAAGAGWTRFAPDGRFRFAGSLAVVFVVSLPLWLVLGSVVPTPQRLKGVEHPTLNPSEALILVGAPMLAALGLTFWRMRGAASIETEKAKANRDRWESEIA